MSRLNYRAAPVIVLALSAATLAAKERAWQTGRWGDYQVTRPKVTFGAVSAPPTGGFAPPPAITEVRTYVIDTEELHLELKETTTSDRPALDVKIGQPVTFALEKNTVYVRDAGGHEHPLHVTKREETKNDETKKEATKEESSTTSGR